MFAREAWLKFANEIGEWGGVRDGGGRGLVKEGGIARERMSLFVCLHICMYVCACSIACLLACMCCVAHAMNIHVSSPEDSGRTTAAESAQLRSGDDDASEDHTGSVGRWVLFDAPQRSSLTQRQHVMCNTRTWAAHGPDRHPHILMQASVYRPHTQSHV
eukprot:GHVU01028420.1.p2 GENE.GHVU01028420.1~~GHVU01028420.1.p2  ORF type:complete len:160 (-),score=14.28 GHVU01028420.1:307-786(-)